MFENGVEADKAESPTGKASRLKTNGSLKEVWNKFEDGVVNGNGHHEDGKEDDRPRQPRMPRPITPPPLDERRLAVDDDKEPERDPNVIRGTDPNQHDILPERGTARARLEMFTKIGQDTDGTARGPRQLTPPPAEQRQIAEREPERDPNVVRESDPKPGDIMPESGKARAMREQFAKMNADEAPREPRAPRPITPPPPEELLKLKSAEERADESAVARDPNVVRGTDPNAYDVLPEEGAARRVKEMFSTLTRTEEPKSRREPRPLTPPPLDNRKFADDAADASTPVMRDPNVIRGSDPNQMDIMPEKGTARARLEMFTSLAKEDSPPREPKAPRPITPPPVVDGSVPHEDDWQPPRDPNVVRGSDPNQADILPEAGIAKARMQLFARMGSEEREPSLPRALRPMTPPPMEQRCLAVDDTVEPVHDPSVVRSSSFTSQSDIMPERGTAKSRLELFAKLGQESDSTRATRGQRLPPRPITPPPLDERRLTNGDTGEHESGNEIERDPNVIRETDPNQNDILPEKGLARARKELFANMVSESGLNGLADRESWQAKEFETRTRSAPALRPITPPPAEERKLVNPDEWQPVRDPNVVRGSDPNQMDIMPEKGTARARLEMFTRINVDDDDDKLRKPPAPRPISPPPLDERRLSSGEIEGPEPVHDPNVVRSALSYDAPVPQLGTTRNLLQRFHQLAEDQQKPNEPKGPRPITPPPLEAGQMSRDSSPELERSADVVVSGSPTEETVPAQGYIRNIRAHLDELKRQNEKVMTSRIAHQPRRFTDGNW